MLQKKDKGRGGARNGVDLKRWTLSLKKKKKEVRKENDKTIDPKDSFNQWGRLCHRARKGGL